jgi:bifunctional UDP-N-acetylglucosamine pyrophosphorylase / glucosamine-1-phosphate N-acetyltransferase
MTQYGTPPYGIINNKCAIVILAAGQGKRLRNPSLPKVLIPLAGRPLIRYVINAVEASGVCQKPLIVVGFHADMVQTALGPDYNYVVQPEQLGTAHAVACTRSALEGVGF